MKEIEVTRNEAGQRLDRFLKKFMPKASAGFIYKMIRKKRIKVNGQRATSQYILMVHDRIQLYLSEDTISEFQNEKRMVVKKATLDVIYEDTNILLVNKPKNLLVHGDKGENYNTLINQVYYHLINRGDYDPKKESTFSPAPCNRLDRNTSGIVIIAKNFPTLQAVNSMMKKDGIIKKYIALVKGKVEEERELKGYLVKDSKSNRVQISPKETKGSKFIHTKYTPIETNGIYSLLSIQIFTGRSHQIRAHLYEEGIPIVGDIKYGDERTNRYFMEKFKLHSQFLHGDSIQFIHCPAHLSYLEGEIFRGDVPGHLSNILNNMGWEDYNGLLEQ